MTAHGPDSTATYTPPTMAGNAEWSQDDFDSLYRDIGLYRTHREWLANQPALASFPPRTLAAIADYRERLAKGLLLKWLDPPTGAHVLDNGCGVGYFLFDLLDAYPDRDLHCTGVDLSQAGLDLLERRKEIEGCDRIESRRADIGKLPFFEGAFDAVVCSEVLDHAPDPAGILREMARVTKPGGKLLITVPNGRAMRMWDGLRAKARHLLGRPDSEEDYFETYLAVADIRRWIAEAGLGIEREALNTALPVASLARMAPRFMQPLAARFYLTIEPLLRSERLSMNYAVAAVKA